MSVPTCAMDSKAESISSVQSTGQSYRQRLEQHRSSPSAMSTPPRENQLLPIWNITETNNRPQTFLYPPSPPAASQPRPCSTLHNQRLKVPFMAGIHGYRHADKPPGSAVERRPLNSTELSSFLYKSIDQQVNISEQDSSSEANFTLWLSDSDPEEVIVSPSNVRKVKTFMGVNEPQVQRPVSRGHDISESENSEDEDGSKSPQEMTSERCRR